MNAKKNAECFTTSGNCYDRPFLNGSYSRTTKWNMYPSAPRQNMLTRTCSVPVLIDTGNASLTSVLPPREEIENNNVVLGGTRKNYKMIQPEQISLKNENNNPNTNDRKFLVNDNLPPFSRVYWKNNRLEDSGFQGRWNVLRHGGYRLPGAVHFAFQIG